jgi:hypothetical protein
MTTTSAALVPIQPAFTDAERLALAGFLAGYRGLTREAYALDLRQFTTWCRTCSVALFAVRRADIESFARDLEGRGRARATVTRRLCTIAGFYKYAVEEELGPPRECWRLRSLERMGHARGHEMSHSPCSRGRTVACECCSLRLTEVPRSSHGETLLFRMRGRSRSGSLCRRPA